MTQVVAALCVLNYVCQPSGCSYLTSVIIALSGPDAR